MRGAVRLGSAILAVQVGAWLIGGHHTLSEERTQLAVCLGVGGWLALVYGAGLPGRSSRPSDGGGRGGSPPGTGCSMAGSATRWWGGTC